METEQNSHQRYAGRYFDAQNAAKYAGRQNETRTHRLETRCITAAFEGLVEGSSVLDLPCGAGRLIPELVALGLNVTEADVAPPMVEEARKYAGEQGLVDQVKFEVADVLTTGFGDEQFDAVICNRLFHHFSEPEIRIAALKELSRISRDRLVISFFCSLSIDAITFHLRNILRGRKSNDRIPIPYSTMKSECEQAGLRVASVHPMRAGISRQWYLKLVKF